MAKMMEEMAEATEAPMAAKKPMQEASSETPEMVVENLSENFSKLQAMIESQAPEASEQLNNIGQQLQDLLTQVSGGGEEAQAGAQPSQAPIPIEAGVRGAPKSPATR